MQINLYTKIDLDETEGQNEGWKIIQPVWLVELLKNLKVLQTAW